jgi:hypothetical protein
VISVPVRLETGFEEDDKHEYKEVKELRHNVGDPVRNVAGLVEVDVRCNIVCNFLGLHPLPDVK